MAEWEQQKKLILPYIKSASEFENVNPKVSYYCGLYALEVTLRLETRNEETRKCLELLVEKLEQQRPLLMLDRDVDKGHCERFALHVYSKAKRREEQGLVDLELVKTYFATFSLIEILKLFGPLSPENREVRSFVVYRAAEIKRHLDEGLTPPPLTPPFQTPREEDMPPALKQGIARITSFEYDPSGGRQSPGEILAPGSMPTGPGMAAGATGRRKGRLTDEELIRRTEDLREGSKEDPTVTPSPFVNGPKDSDSTESDSADEDEESGSVRAVLSLSKGSSFGDGSFLIKAGSIMGKSMLRLAMEVESGEDAVLKFYEDPELLEKTLRLCELLSPSPFISKPLRKVNAHEGLPDCLVFEKATYTLDEWLKNPDTTAGNKRKALQQIAAALEDLHSYDVVHCDVKPENLAFFEKAHKWKLLDLDSTLKSGETSAITTSIPYAAPEILQAVKEGQEELAIEASADMWSYGIIAFEIFTGERFYTSEVDVESAVEFLHSDQFRSRLKAVEDKKQRHFVKSLLKLDATERETAQWACTSKVLESTSIIIRKATLYFK